MHVLVLIVVEHCSGGLGHRGRKSQSVSLLLKSSHLTLLLTGDDLRNPPQASKAMGINLLEINKLS
jgi:hypothetical protein